MKNVFQIFDIISHFGMAALFWSDGRQKWRKFVYFWPHFILGAPMRTEIVLVVLTPI